MDPEKDHRMRECGFDSFYPESHELFAHIEFDLLIPCFLLESLCASCLVIVVSVLFGNLTLRCRFGTESRAKIENRWCEKQQRSRD